MTEVAFHFNAPDKLGYVCRLLRKATGAGARVVVTGAADSLSQLDTALWTFGALEFVPHCRADSDAALVAHSPVVLAEALTGAPSHGVLVNLGDEVPAGFERFERLIEIVTAGETDRTCARNRWRHYTDRGYAIVRHDLAQKASN